MKTRIIGYFSVIVGISVIGMWAMILSSGNLPEGKTEISFHLASEFLMALLCLISGILLLRGKSAGKILNITALGMVVYSVINAAGYYGERDNPAMMLMFIVLLLLTVTALIMHIDR